MAAFGLTNFLNDVGCKLVFYFHKVARDLSLCTTCLLSGFQAITLSSKSFWWSKFKARAPKYSVPFYFICWTFHLLTNHKILLYMNSPKESNNITKRKNYIYCDSITAVSLDIKQYLLTISLPDVLWIGFMVGTSGYMIYVLYRHRQRVQYVHGIRLTPCGSPETRATQTILLLVILFVSFYSLNSILALYIYYEKSSSWLFHISAFLSACFPACSSFVLIVSDSQVRRCYLALWEKTMIQF
ncbi:vomeronasal type-1 receptor 1-like [Sarcophilus harrisii]